MLRAWPVASSVDSAIFSILSAPMWYMPILLFAPFVIFPLTSNVLRFSLCSILFLHELKSVMAIAKSANNIVVFCACFITLNIYCAKIVQTSKTQNLFWRFTASEAYFRLKYRDSANEQNAKLVLAFYRECSLFSLKKQR